MNKPCPHILAKSPEQGDVTLADHTEQVLAAAEKIADYLQLDEKSRTIVRWGAILHDMGKANPVFQERLRSKRKPDVMQKPYRHELGSLLFTSLVPSDLRNSVIDMIVAHHRSSKNDARKQGIVDLDEAYELKDRGGKVFEMHFGEWDQWSKEVASILDYFGIDNHPISRDEAFASYYDSVEYCASKPNGYSFWKGLLVAADHLASSVNDKVYDVLKNSFVAPDLSWYHDSNRQSALYPLSIIDTNDSRKHTLVTAPTGAGKTDFLLRRCKGRVFYLLPFQASINAMFERFKNSVPGTDTVRLLHAASKLILASPNNWTEKAIQDKAGAPLKVLTPYQVASIAFGTKGFESMLVDLQGCDVILDEIHTYTDVSRAIVLRIIEVLRHIGCRVHVGTATMPTELKQKVLLLLGETETYEVTLPSEQLDTFDRHIIHKAPDLESTFEVVDRAMAKGEKVLIVMNQVKRAQDLFERIKDVYSDMPSMLIHSRFMRGQRAALEKQLKEDFDQKPDPCIVVSTQVVEVSLDISFDVMITVAAPLDSLIQRFGRVNRRRNASTLHKYKSVYVIAPSEDAKENLPYDHELVQKSYAALPDGEVLRERQVQDLIDTVFCDIKESSIDFTAVPRSDKKGGTFSFVLSNCN